MKKIIISLLMLFCGMATEIVGYSYTFYNKTPGTIFLEISKFVCSNVQPSGAIAPNASFTFQTGACCVNKLTIKAGEYVYEVSVNSGDTVGEVSLPSTGFSMLCGDYQGTIFPASGNSKQFKLVEGKH